MEGMPTMNAIEWVALALNPFPILVRSRRECGLEGHGYVAALTDRFEATKNLPHGMHIILHFFGNLVESVDVGLNCDTIVPVSRQDWPKLRDVVNRDAARVSGARVYSFGAETSYMDMLVNGFRCLLDNYETFEGVSFPAKFPYGKGVYCEKRKHVSFPEYYVHLSRLRTHESQAHAPWLVWCKLIDLAAQWVGQQVILGEMEERRHYPFVENHCAVVGPAIGVLKCSQCQLISYCHRDYQREDWPRHKKYCKKAFAPGCPL
jgi:hypothetical protein